MRYLFLLILLAGCTGEPDLLEVDRNQPGGAPAEFDVRVRQMSPEAFLGFCGEGHDLGVVPGCYQLYKRELWPVLSKDGLPVYSIVTRNDLTPAELAVTRKHEYEHILYGPCHVGDVLGVDCEPVPGP